MLIVTEIVEPADAYGFALAVAIGAAPDEAPFNDRDNDMLKQAVDGLIEKYSDVVRNRGAIYAHAAVRLDRGWRFVYLTLLLVAPADCVKH